MTQIFAMPPCASWQVPGGTLLYSRYNGAKIVVTHEVATVIRSCDSFLTLDEHVQQLARRFPALQENPEDVRQVLDSLRRAEVLIPADALCQKPSGAASEVPTPGKPVICITTCDRPDRVRQLFDSLLRNVRLSRFSRVCLIDDSRDAITRKDNAEAVTEFALRSPIQAIHVGHDIQDALMKSLVVAFPEVEDALECLLGRRYWGRLPTYGRARNLALLLTVGERCVVLDDDVLCEARQAPRHGAGAVAFGEPRVAYFLSGTGDLQNLPTLEEDPLQALTRFLGHSLDHTLEYLVGDTLSPEKLAGVPAGFLGRLGPDARILVTQCGSWGDPGTPDNSWLANLDRESVQRLLDFPGGIAGAFASRQVWLGHSRPTFSAMANMSQVTGLDNRALLPPYLSGLRGEDRLFGTITGCLHPRSLVLEHAWAIAHRPFPERVGNPEGDPGVPRGGVGLLDAWVEELLPVLESPSPESRLVHIGEHIAALGDMSEHDLHVQFGRLLTNAQVYRLQILEEQLRTTGKYHPLWEAWLSRDRDAVMQTLPSQPSLADMPAVPAETTARDVAQAVRTTASHYAKILEQWPAIRAAAADFSAALVI